VALLQRRVRVDASRRDDRWKDLLRTRTTLTLNQNQTLTLTLLCASEGGALKRTQIIFKKIRVFIGLCVRVDATRRDDILDSRHLL
jgi:hypothetical protein